MAEGHPLVGIYYHPEAYSTRQKKLMGRNAAGESFLKGFFRHAAPRASLFAQVSSSEYAAELSAQARLHSRAESIQAFTNQDLHRAEEAEVIYFPGPGIGQLARDRRLYADDAWALCGITHTTSSARAMDDVAQWVTSPVQPWDAVICTSTAVKTNVEVVLQAQVDELKDRLGITKIVLPQLPVIPLGIHTDDFAFTERQRYEARERLNLDNDTTVVLYTGRLSFHAKAHPLVMYQALEAAAKASGKKVALVECGWHGNDHIEAAFAEGAKSACPSVKTILLDGRDPTNRQLAWAGADIFCSLPDNIQETFGIVPVEAMAAGLPVVVSDWNGYKDTVRDGIDGFRIPTLAPAPGMAGDLARRHAMEIDTYDMYCGHSSSLVAVHGAKLAQAFSELIRSPDLRQKMGRAGKLRATQDYDWKNIIPRYESLWDEQKTMRLAAKIDNNGTRSSLAKPLSPARLDPTIGFANYPTAHLTLATQLTLSESSADLALSRLTEYTNLAMVNYAAYVFPTDAELESVFRCAALKLPYSATAEELISDIVPERQPYVLRALAWLCKLGLFQFS